MDNMPPPPPMDPLGHGGIMNDATWMPHRRNSSRRRSFIVPEIFNDDPMEVFADWGDAKPVKEGKEKKKDKEKKEEFPVPVEKPGTPVHYESYRFTKIDTWEKAGRQRLNVPMEDLEDRVKARKSRNEPSIFEQMRKMSSFRAEQINRLLEDKGASTKDPHYEWACADINAKKVTTKKGLYEVPSMDVILVMMVRKDLPVPAPEEPKKNIPGEYIDLSKKPEKEKKEKDKKEKHKDKHHEEVPWLDDLVLDEHGRPMVVNLDGQNHAHGGLGHGDPLPDVVNLGPTNAHHDGFQFVDEHAPMPHVPMVPKQRSRSRHRPVYDVGHLPIDSSADDDISVFFDDDGHSSRTSHSIDFEKHIPRRGSLRPERRLSYREHRRNNGYGAYPRYDYRSSGEYAEVIPERSYGAHHHRPDVGRRRTLQYFPARPEITYHDDPLPPRSHASYSHSPPEEFERERREREIQDMERELELREREERLERKERDLDRHAERKRQDLLDRLSKRSSGRDPYGYRY